MKINIFWFRRDLRLEDNTGLTNAMRSGLPVLPLFIFDINITGELPVNDPRISFIHDTLFKINADLLNKNGNILILKGDPAEEFEKLLLKYEIEAVFANRDYEPYAIRRDTEIASLLHKHGIRFLTFKDQVIFEEDEIVKPDGSPYTVFTPYRNAWLKKSLFSENLHIKTKNEDACIYFASGIPFPSLEALGFRKSLMKVRAYDLSVIDDYDKFRDYPAADRTTYLSPHLRFGTVSIRSIVPLAMAKNSTFLGELIWREFFMQILFHFPDVVTENFKSTYNFIRWRNNEPEFERWCTGETGYPMVDAGMRQLNETGYMHNRVRMITAGFLCKHLLTDWRLGEAWFAARLLDYDLAANNGNWQWAAGTGCDAAPWFRIFNPLTQERKFDPSHEYINKWIPESASAKYPGYIVEHSFARQRAIEIYQSALKAF